jgi:plastocyanin
MSLFHYFNSRAGRTDSCATIFGSRELTDMKRLPIAIIAMLLFSASLFAASLNGKIAFVSKRGQTPTVGETLVWLEPVTTSKTPSKRPPVNTQLVTRSKSLVPHIVAVPAGSTIAFPNDDAISHNLFSVSSANAFDLGLYRKGAGKSHKFDTPGVVNVYCNVHPNMSAVVHVMSSPWYAFADANGNYSLADVPAGKYRLVAWNEQGGTIASPVEVNASGLVSGNLNLTLDSRNYREQQHLNKVGKPYVAPRERDY